MNYSTSELELMRSSTRGPLTRVFWGVVTSLFLSWTSVAHSEISSSDAVGANQIVVIVRTVKATDRIPEQEVGDDSALTIDPGLSDLRTKLNTLHFRTFRLLDQIRVVVPVKKKETFPLGSGQMLTVRPLYHEGDKIGVWLKWCDRQGAALLDTRMHLNSGQSMLAGTDQEPDGGLILAIQVTPQ